MFKRIIYGTAIVTILAAAAPAHAASCAKRDTVIKRLQDKYTEQLTAGGLQNSRTASSVVEVWASPETGTFTVMLTNAHGMTCIVAAGTNWFADTPQPKVAGTAS